MHKTETVGQPEIMIRKDMLQHLTSLGIPNTEIAKSFNISRVLVAHCMQFHQSFNVLRDLEDDN